MAIRHASNTTSFAVPSPTTDGRRGAIFGKSPILKTVNTVPVVVTENGRNCIRCGQPLAITVLEFYADPQRAPVAIREGFVDCLNGCTGVIDPRERNDPALSQLEHGTANKPGLDTERRFHCEDLPSTGSAIDVEEGFGFM